MLKNFWSDFKNLSRFQFGCKYIFPAAAVLLTWMAVGGFYTAGLTKKQLAEYTGRVDNIGILSEHRNSKRNTYTYHSLRIVMLQYNEVFRLRDDFDYLFPVLLGKINEGDTITVYKRTPLQTLISWGNIDDIYQIEKNGVVLLPLNIVVNDNVTWAKWLTVMAIIFWMPYAYYKWDKIKAKKKY